MASVNYIETISTSLNGIPKKFGQMILCTDNNTIYYDNSDNQRILLNGVSEIGQPSPSKIKEPGKLYICGNDIYTSVKRMVLDPDSESGRTEAIVPMKLTASKIKNLIFYLGKKTKVGRTPMTLSLSRDFKPCGILIRCDTAGTSVDTKFNILVTNNSNIDPSTEWTTLNKTPLVLSKGKYYVFGSTFSSNVNEIPDESYVNYQYKVEVVEADPDVKGVTVDIECREVFRYSEPR